MTTATSSAEATLTPKDVAKLRKMSPRTVTRLATAGVNINGTQVVLGHVRSGRMFRFNEQHLREYDEACRMAEQGQPSRPTPTASEKRGQEAGERVLDRLRPRRKKPA